MSGQKHLCCGFLVKVKHTSGSCSLTNYLSGILDRQGLMVAAPVESENKES